MKISFCEQNVAVTEVREKINKNYPDVQTTINKCIGECGKCNWDYIARINGKLVFSESSDELYGIIEEAIKKK